VVWHLGWPVLDVHPSPSRLLSAPIPAGDDGPQPGSYVSRGSFGPSTSSRRFSWRAHL